MDQVLHAARVHPAMRDEIADSRRGTLQPVQSARPVHDIVIALMFFVKGVSIGGYDDPHRLMASGELEQLRAAPRAD